MYLLRNIVTHFFVSTILFCRRRYRLTLLQVMQGVYGSNTTEYETSTVIGIWYPFSSFGISSSNPVTNPDIRTYSTILPQLLQVIKGTFRTMLFKERVTRPRGGSNQ